MTNNYFKRKITRQVPVGSLILGGGQPIRVQSMTNVHTHDIDACVAQINRLVQRGCEIVRIAVPMPKDTAALKEIICQVSVPVVADVHFHFQRALEAVEAGVAKIRLNPGNIQDRAQVKEVIAACKAHGVAIRVGVNEGSIVERKDKTLQAREQEKNLIELMTEKMAEYVAIFEEAHFDRLVLSAKCHDAARTVAVNRALAQHFAYPLHLGVTHAGDIQTGSVRSAAALGALLTDGIGDTLRVSLAGDPAEEVAVAWEILASLGLRPRRGPELIACPTCGRTEIDLLAMVEKVKIALADIQTPIVVAVMGCVVNGPGEAADADVALCGGKDRAVIYCRGQKIGTYPEAQAIEKLLEQVRKVIGQNKCTGHL